MDSNVYVKITYNFIFLILTLIVNPILCFRSYSDFVLSLDFVTVFLSSCCTPVDFVTWVLSVVSVIPFRQARRKLRCCYFAPWENRRLLRVYFLDRLPHYLSVLLLMIFMFQVWVPNAHTKPDVGQWRKYYDRNRSSNKVLCSLQISNFDNAEVQQAQFKAGCLLSSALTYPKLASRAKYVASS